MLTDDLDDNNEKVMECFFSKGNGNGNNNDQDRKDKEAVALELAKEKIFELFLDKVKTPYAAIKVNDHIETMSIDSKKFEDWVGAAYYITKKQKAKTFLYYQKKE